MFDRAATKSCCWDGRTVDAPEGVPASRPEIAGAVAACLPVSLTGPTVLLSMILVNAAVLLATAAGAATGDSGLKRLLKIARVSPFPVESRELFKAADFCEAQEKLV